jgi:hypothetical protein
MRSEAAFTLSIAPNASAHSQDGQSSSEHDDETQRRQRAKTYRSLELHSNMDTHIPDRRIRHTAGSKIGADLGELDEGHLTERFLIQMRRRGRRAGKYLGIVGDTERGNLAIDAHPLV